MSSPRSGKVEGLDRREDYERVALQARSAGRAEVACIILGRGASDAQLENWLREEGGVAGFIGFAIGRTIWQHALTDWLAGKLGHASASRTIADNYLRMVDIYLRASAHVDSFSEQPTT